MTKNLRQTTIDTYDASAEKFKTYFGDMGARSDDIELAYELSENREHPRVFEIGCGDGRDAAYIMQKASFYLGMDPAEKLLEIARERAPQATFQTGDITDFIWPQNVDVVFAFASLLHLDSDEVQQVLEKAYEALNPGGVFYISLKYSETYKEVIQEDEFGKRQFFLYSPEIIEELNQTSFEVVFSGLQQHGGREWFSIVLKKPC